MPLTWIPVPVDEAQAFFRKRVYTLEDPATPFEAKLHAALLFNTGELTQWSVSDLAVQWGWETAERCKWKTTPRAADGSRVKQCEGWAAMSRVKRLLEEVKTPVKSWTLISPIMENQGLTDRPRVNSGCTTARPELTTARQTTENQGLTDPKRVHNDKTKANNRIPRARTRGDASSLLSEILGDIGEEDLEEEKMHASSMHDSAGAEQVPEPVSSPPDLFKEMGELLIARGLRSPWGLLQQFRTKYGNEYLYPAIESTLDETIDGPHGEVKSRLLFHLGRLTRTKVSTVMNGGKVDESKPSPKKPPAKKKEPPKPRHIVEIDLEDCAKQGCMFCQARVNEADDELVYPKAGWVAIDWAEEYGVTSHKWNGR